MALSLSTLETALSVLAAFSAFVAGFAFSKHYAEERQFSKIRKTLVSSEALGAKERKTASEKLINLMKATKYAPSKVGAIDKFVAAISKSEKLNNELRLAGLSRDISPEVLVVTQLKTSVLVAIVFALVGLVFSTELCAIGFLLGAVAGFLEPRSAVRKIVKKRSVELEQHLPEMLEILCIGIRSGLSFDRSCDLYVANFDTILSFEISRAKELWQSGIQSREEALRDIASSYDSLLFSRTIEGVIRTLKLGTSVSEGLMSSAKEARAVYKASREEQVRKAPIKMMIPTGTLILPAMLLLIMGPVLLELIGGGV